MGAIVITVYLAINFISEYDILIIVAAWAIGFSKYYIDNDALFKVGVLSSQVLWMTYSLIFNDYAMIATCGFIMISNGYALFKILSEQNVKKKYKVRIV